MRIDVAVGVIVHRSSVLIAQRAKHLHQGDKWEFPGGKIEPGESQQQALCRELEEEVCIQVTECAHWFSLSFDYPDKSVNLHIWGVTDFTGEPEGREGQPLRWAPIDTLPQYTFPEANQPIIERLQQGNF
ncbi:8-oxo-dGTP diphosphatase MutT [Alteromonas oceanisediminis]|uniref:8-oxo-dGTP diphosphatase MutT n=1 Tax=Alteromonas oceanisediminis TaxID=2836180 RepID=UPI001BDA3D26|nr:8-oxo-dGTP diphosphatase MutT [Alteromonas oceanisediminis]MBT0585534.1 8-oxo-dGTP diphosphatase MutT [Alteromonas oceanisediminis]